MKKIWILAIILAAVVVFLTGLYFGSDVESRRMLGAFAQRNIAGRQIAVINADTGVLVDGARLNYSAAIIETLGEDFVLVSPAMAQNGLIGGLYRAVLTFPANVSERVLSFNRETPERVVLEIQVNPNLSESEYVKTHVDLLNLQTSINLTMGYTYLSSVFSQFHAAQDQMTVVFQNKQTTVEATEAVRLEDFSPSLQLELMPEIELETVEADTSEHFLTVTDFAEQVKTLYLMNFEEAAMSYTIMRQLVDSLTHYFPMQRESWFEVIETWSSEWVEYAVYLQDYSNYVMEYLEYLIKWHNYDAIPWHTELRIWHTGIGLWHEALECWLEGADDWYENTLRYIEDVKRFHSTLETWRVGLDTPGWGEAISALANRPTIDDLPPCDCNTYECECGYDCEYEHKYECEYDCECGYGYDCMYDCGHDCEYDCRCECGDDCGYDCDYKGACSQHPPDAPINCEEARKLALEYLINYWADSVVSLMQDALEKDSLASVSWLESFNRLEGSSWREANMVPPPYVQPPNLSESISVAIERDTPKTWDETTTPPIIPTESAPPQPDALWANIYLMHETMYQFSIEDYLTDTLWEQAQSLLNAYYSYLEIVRDDLSFQFLENIFVLYDVRFEYTEYLRELREAILESENEARTHLQETLYEFFGIADNNHIDTRERLEDFADMMPLSRAVGGVNQDLVNFTIAPVEFVAPILRSNSEIITTPFTEAFLLWLWIALAVLGVVFLMLIILHVVKTLRRNIKVK